MAAPINKNNISLRCTQIPFFINEWSKANEELPSSKLILEHRRAGKSMGEALEARQTFIDWYREEEIFNLRGDVDSYNPTMYYIAPTKIQARDIIWGYIQRFVGSLPGVKLNNQSLTAKMARPHLGDEITLKLMASKYHDAIRGSKLRKAWLDEVQMSPSKALPNSIWPTVKDSAGNLTMTGTVNGRDHVYTLAKMFIENEWPFYMFPVTRTGIFTKEEILNFQKEGVGGSFEREYMLDFYAPIEGTFFANKLYELERDPNFFSAMKDDSQSIVAGIDIGVGKGFACWVANGYPRGQGNRIDILDFYHDYNKLDDLYNDMAYDGHIPDVMFVPHDADKRQLSSSKVVRNKDVIKDSFPGTRVITVDKPGNQMADIEHTLRHLHLLHFRNSEEPGHDCEMGYSMLKEYSRKKSDVTGQYTDQVDKSRGIDHAGDALRTLIKGFRIKNGEIRMVPTYRAGEGIRVNIPKPQSIFVNRGNVMEVERVKNPNFCYPETKGENDGHEKYNVEAFRSLQAAREF